MPAKENSPDLVPDPHGSCLPEVGVCTIAEFEKLIDELQETKKYLQSEGERIQRETVHYNNVARTASESVRIISETVREWREAGRPVLNGARSRALEISRNVDESTNLKEPKAEVEADNIKPTGT
jgi:hypothetical protein